jgi:hypothetical protein
MMTKKAKSSIKKHKQKQSHAYADFTRVAIPPTTWPWGGFGALLWSGDGVGLMYSMMYVQYVYTVYIILYIFKPYAYRTVYSISYVHDLSAASSLHL